MFIAVGFVTIIVGSFLLRGNMHMWDKSGSKISNEKEKNDLGTFDSFKVDKDT